MAVVWFLLMIGPLVFFHELGHFIAAKAFDIRCRRFAVGIGPAVASIHRWGTEFSIRALPFGGYVQLAGATPDDDVDDADRGFTMADRPVWKRMAVYLAGPAANVALALPLLWLTFFAERAHQGAEVGTVLDGTPAAAAGFRPGDRITAVDDDPVRYFDDVVRVVSRSPDTPLKVTVLRGGDLVALSVTPEPIPGPGGRRVGMIGLVWSRYAAIVDVAPSSAAARAGLRDFDRVVRVGQTPVEAWLDLESLLAASPRPTVLQIERPRRTSDAFAALFVPVFAEVTLADPGDAATLGIRAAEATVFAVEPMSPAEQAGLQAGDRIVSARGRPVTSLEILAQRMLSEPDEPYALIVDRGGADVSLTVTPRALQVAGELGSVNAESFLGLAHAPDDRVPYALIHMPAGERLVRATVQAFSETFALILGFVAGLFMLITGSMDSSNLGGPLMIAEVANRAGSEGLATFTRFMAVISVNLAVINLAPVPGLDGGNLILLAAEGIRREPLSLRARNLAGYVGMVCLVLLMLFAFKNDIERNWVDIARWLNA